MTEFPGKLAGNESCLRQSGVQPSLKNSSSTLVIWNGFGFESAFSSSSTWVYRADARSVPNLSSAAKAVQCSINHTLEASDVCILSAQVAGIVAFVNDLVEMLQRHQTAKRLGVRLDVA